MISHQSNNIYDVLIVGAGPVGLSIAVGLRKRGINNILVIDQTTEFRQVGQVVDLLPNGLKAIKYVDPSAYQALVKLGENRTSSQDKNQNNSSRKWYLKALDGSIIRSTALDFKSWFNEYGEGRISVPWFELQKTLKDLLPSELIKVNHRCISLSEEKEWIEITCCSDPMSYHNPFAHWDMKKAATTDHSTRHTPNLETLNLRKFKAKIVIGADGINSTVRQIIYANTELERWAKPQYSGWTAMGCFSINNISSSLIDELESKYIHNNKVVTIQKTSSNSDNFPSPRIMLLHFHADSMGYLFHTPLNLENLQKRLPIDIKNVVIKILNNAGFSESICDLVNLTPEDDMIYRPYYIHPANISCNSHLLWSRGSVVLVGDAAHGMPPFAAQGTNQGFEDAAIISKVISKIVKNKQLDNPSFTAQEFAKYEEIRRPFMIKIQTATMENHNWSISQWEDYQNLVYRRDLEQLFRIT